MTPYELQVLLHYHCTAEPFPNDHLHIHGEVVAQFVKAGILRRTMEGPAKWCTTEYGKAYVEKVLATPLYPLEQPPIEVAARATAEGAMR